MMSEWEYLFSRRRPRQITVTRLSESEWYVDVLKPLHRPQRRIGLAVLRREEVWRPYL